MFTSRTLLFFGLFTGFLLTVPAVFAKKEPKSIPFEDTGPFQHVDGSGPHRDTHERLQHQRNRAKVASAPASQSSDVGDVAVIVDNGSIFIQPHPAKPIDFTLPTNLNFTPVSGCFAVAFAAANFDPLTGGALPLGDDDSVPVALPFTFPFLGGSYASVLFPEASGFDASVDWVEPLNFDSRLVSFARTLK